MANPVARGEEDTLVAVIEHSAETYRYSCTFAPTTGISDGRLASGMPPSC
jgi:hypothetical protein